jgi:hypothetical protein
LRSGDFPAMFISVGGIHDRMKIVKYDVSRQLRGTVV